MSERIEYELTQDEFDNLIESMKTGPLIMLQCGPPPSQQELANNAWASLGEKRGFDGKSVKPSSKGQMFFTAEVNP